MANNEFNVKVSVSDNGSLKLSTKQIDNLGKSVDRVSASNKKASNTTKEFNYDQARGVATISNSTRSFSKLAETIGGNSNGLVAAYAELAANIFAVSAAFNALRGASQVEQIMKGLEAAGSRTGQALKVTATELRAVTGNAIDMEQALRSTAQISAGGFGADTIKALGQAAKDTSFALGRNMTDSLDRLTRGVIKLEPELLDELGIMTKLTESNSLYAAKLGKTETQLTNYEKRVGFLNAVLAETTLKFGGLSDEAGNLKAYDQLAATFTDLKNSTLNLVNEALRPLAAVFAGSPSALLGVAILFGSTLATRLLPFLANSASSAQKAAVASTEYASKMHIATQEAYNLAKAEQSVNITRLQNLRTMSTAGPKAYANLRDSINAGTASIKDQQSAIVSLQRSVNANDALTKNNPKYAPGTPGGDQKARQIEEATAEIKRIKDLQTARAIADQSNINGIASVRRAKYLEVAAINAAAAAEARAAAIGAASQYNIRESIKQTKISTLEYAGSVLAQQRAQQLNGEAQLSFGQKARGVYDELKGSAKQIADAYQGSALTGVNKLKVATYGAATAAKALGVAFLAAIPVIGQAVLIAGLLKSAYDFLQPAAVQEFSKAFEKFKEVIDSTENSIEAFIRIQTSLAPLAARTEQALIIQSNAIRTLSEAYDDLYKKSDKVVASSGKSGKVSFLGALFGSTDDIKSYHSEIDKSSKVFGVLKQQLEKPEVGHAYSQSYKEITATAKALEELYKLAPEATDRLVKLGGGLNALGKSDNFAAKVKKIFDTINNDFGGVAERVKTLTEAFKALNQSIGEFLLSGVQSTPFDQIVKNFQSVNNELSKFQAAAARSRLASGENYKNILASIGNNATLSLSVDTKDAVDQLNILANEIQLLKSKGAEADAGVLEAKIKTFEASKGILDVVAQELRASQQAVELAQTKNRLLQGQQQLLQANLTANQANYAATASGVKAQLEGENAVKQLQIAQIEVQVTLLETYQAQNREILRRLEQQLENIKLEYKLNDAINEGSILYAQRYAQTELTNAENRLRTVGLEPSEVLANPNYAKGLSDEKTQLVNAYLAQKRTFEDTNKLSDVYLKIKETRQSTKAAEESIKAFRSQQAAILITELTTGQITANMEAKRVEILNAQLTQLQAQKKAIANITDLEEKSNRLATGRAETLADQLSAISRNAKEQRSSIDTEYTKTTRTLNAELGKARADRAKATSENDKRASADRISLIEEQLRIEQQGYSISLAELDAQTRYNVLEKASFDVQTEGLSMQKESLDYFTKALDVQRSVVELAREERSLRAEISRRSSGRAQTESSKKIETIEAARDAYEFAQQEAELKRTVIKLEYALLEAQRITFVQNLKAQRALLAADPRTNPVMIGQLDAAIGNLEKAEGLIQRAQAGALQVADKELEIARLKVLKAALPEGRRPTFSDEVRDAKKLAIIRGEVLGGGTLYASKELADPVIAPIVKSNEILAVALTGLAIDVQALDRSITLQMNDKSKTVESATNSTLTRIPGITKASQVTPLIERDLGVHVTSDKRRPGEAGKAGANSPHVTDRALDVRPTTKVTPSEILTYLRSLGFQNVKFIDETSPAIMKKTGATGPHWHFQWSGVLQSADQKATTSVNVLTDQATKAIVETSATAQKAIYSNADSTAKAMSDMPNNDIIVNGIRAANDNGLATSEPKTDPATAMPATSKFLELYGQVMAQPYSISEVFQKMADELGPAGTIVPTILEGITTVGDSYLRMKDVFNSDDSTFADKFSAVAEVAQTALATIQSALAAGAEAKVAAIDKEINAEQKRDGKSAESVQKIQALERKKDDIARKQFNTNKKIQMAQAVIATAAGIAQALSYGPIAGPILAGVIAAMGAAQIAIIAGTSYQSSATAANATPEMPSLTIGKRGSSVDLAKQNNNVGGELGYLRGTSGTGSNSSNYRVIGSAYGGELPRGYGNSAYVVGEKGPETIVPTVPMSVRPANDNGGQAPINAKINIHAIDSQGVANVLMDQRGNIISMLREAANASGQNFLEDVDVNVYTRPNVSKL